jgi:RNA 3'-terminal phosphate cyclase (ATP)
MIEIDGAIGYGQVLRTAIALSCLTLKPIKIFNIRKGRPKPGLMAQHLMGVKIAGEFCNAEIKGLKLYSTEVEFSPKSFNISDKKIDIGTAGQISLLLQTLTPLLIFSDKEVNLEIIGGTAGLGAPTIQFIEQITFPILSKLGVKQPEIEVLQEGFYPRGGGRVKIKFFPVKKLNSIKLVERGEVKKIKGISIAGSLPKNVAERQANAAKEFLKKKGFENVEIEVKSVETFSPGTSITLWAECENSILGSDNIGKKGVRAEKIGEDCARELINSIESKAALDKFMADQIIPFLALAEGESEISVEKITDHCSTNIFVVEKILGVKFEVKGEKGKFGKIFVKGIGFNNFTNS